MVHSLDLESSVPCVLARLLVPTCNSKLRRTVASQFVAVNIFFTLKYVHYYH